LSVILLAMTAMPLAGKEGGFFPPAARGWDLAPEEEIRTPENLYEYIDGASELYISYGFEKLTTRRYLSTGQPEITVDLFDMGAPKNAFGIFAHSQEAPNSEIGQDSEYLDGLLRFWQGRYYVSLSGSPETPELRLALMDLGRQIAERLPPAAGRPEILSFLPQEGLLAASLRCFHHHAWQNTYLFVADDDILGIDAGAEAVLAKYDQGQGRPVVLLVLYPDLAAAARAFAGLGRRFNLPDGAGKTVRQPGNKNFTAAREKNAIAAVWHGGSAEQALELLSRVRAKVMEAKDTE